MDEFKTIADIQKWANELFLEVRRDLIEKNDKTIPCVYLRSFEDRSVGIIGTEISPIFTYDDIFIRWVNENRETVEKLEFDDLLGEDVRGLIEQLTQKGEAEPE